MRVNSHDVSNEVNFVGKYPMGYFLLNHNGRSTKFELPP